MREGRGEGSKGKGKEGVREGRGEGRKGVREAQGVRRRHRNSSTVQTRPSETTILSKARTYAHRHAHIQAHTCTQREINISIHPRTHTQTCMHRHARTQTHPERTPKTRLRTKNEPMMMRGMK